MNMLELGLTFKDPALIEHHYASLKGVFLHSLKSTDPTSGCILDLDSLPTEPVDLKGAVIKWLIAINLPRISASQPPVITLELALKCPVWKVIKPPLRKIALTKEGTFNRPKVKTLRQKRSPGSL